MKKIIPLLIVLACNCKSLEKEYNYQFHQFESYHLNIPELREASGIAASGHHDNLLYSLNDSGNSPEIFLMDFEGQPRGRYVLEGVHNRDWEDIAVGAGPDDKQHIYVAEIGDNLAQYDVKYIYRFLEPDVLPNEKGFINISNFDSIRFRFPDGNRDAEALLIEPTTKDLYIFSKREDTVGIYLARYPQSVNEVIQLEKAGQLNTKNVVAGSISPDSREVLIKTYEQILYWHKEPEQPAYKIISENIPEYLPYEVEPQGESITWHPEKKGFFTLSEEPGGIEASLYFYKRTADDTR